MLDLVNNLENLEAEARAEREGRMADYLSRMDLYRRTFVLTRSPRHPHLGATWFV
nr:hypothetical protein [Methylobacterium nodulans]